jgi:transcriptional regulator with XRE-family HTH domain
VVATAERPNPALGARVRAARVALPREDGREVSQAEVAARIGWNQQRYSKIESGRQKTLSVEDLHALAGALDEDPYYLFTGLRVQNVSHLAAQIDRLDLDEWGQDAVLETAQREARRTREQRSFLEEADAIERDLRSAGIDDQAIERALRRLRSSAFGSGVSPEGPAPESRQVGRR